MASENVGTAPKERKRRRKVVVARGKRKEAVARATVKDGSGLFAYNGKPLALMSDALLRQVVREPLRFVDPSKFDVSINVGGGGVMGQAQAARTALSKALVAIGKDETLKERMLDADRSLLVEDPRRVEPKKFKGPKARARFTKSYR
ncbi:30S ribosomal protein S9 [Candidatus Micrarchaeota archaeon]|nr:30S ribosomal protein S9 [Candidatus Micrarchaeota archaeon]MBI5177382.1 30S ribosomal protein S9 [Candidatus Micrarchaeota archaeon]